MVVTGSSSGLGKAVALEALAQNWRVVGLARRDAGIVHPNYGHFKTDLTEVGTFPGLLVQWFLEHKINLKPEHLVLVNNAAQVGPLCPLTQLTPIGLEKAFRLNVIAPMLLSSFLLKSCTWTRFHIVNISSRAAVVAYEGMSAYCSAKAALRMFSQNLIKEQSQNGVKVISYSPGVLDTPMQAEIRNTELEEYENHQHFQELYDSGTLVDPKYSASELLELIEKPDLEGFTEYRFKGR